MKGLRQEVTTILVVVALAACTTGGSRSTEEVAASDLSGVVFKGGDGSDCMNQGVIQNVNNTLQAKAAVERWLAMRYPGYRQQPDQKSEDSTCEGAFALAIANRSGTERIVFLSVTSEFDSPEEPPPHNSL